MTVIVYTVIVIMIMMADYNDNYINTETHAYKKNKHQQQHHRVNKKTEKK